MYAQASQGPSLISTQTVGQKSQSTLYGSEVLLPVNPPKEYASGERPGQAGPSNTKPVGTGVGSGVGSGVGTGVGSGVGKGVGTGVGSGVGSGVGAIDGGNEGLLDGIIDATSVGTKEGDKDGISVGLTLTDGAVEGLGEGYGEAVGTVGPGEGCPVSVGEFDGTKEGSMLSFNVGTNDSVGMYVLVGAIVGLSDGRLLNDGVSDGSVDGMSLGMTDSDGLALGLDVGA